MIAGAAKRLRYTTPLSAAGSRRIESAAAHERGASRWLVDRGAYINADTGRSYQPHHDAEQAWLLDHHSRYLLAKGGEGGGKSVAGIVKSLERMRVGCSGIMGSPDFEHFKRSLWPEFRRWCPPDALVAKDRRKLQIDWQPPAPFVLTFVNGAQLYCGGFDDPAAWEGPNVNFAHVDEARRKKEPLIVKVLDGRIRIAGPHGEQPALWLTTTPRKHWLYDMFGPLKRDAPDPYADFKRDTHVIDLLTIDNERMGNLAAGFTQQRRQSLTESEARVLLEAAWEDTDDSERFLPSMALWDACRGNLPPFDAHTPVVLAADGAVSGDSFALVGVSLHPDQDDVLIPRIVRQWIPNGAPLDFDVIEQEIRGLCGQFAVVHLAYDPYQLHQMASRLHRDGVVPTEAFHQGADRLVADKELLDRILQRRILHDGDVALRQALDHADRKVDTETRRIRLIKRTQSLKIDPAVALSMAAHRATTLWLNTPSTAKHVARPSLGGARRQGGR